MNKCDSCDIDLGSDYLVIRGRAFCCTGCSEGGPCICSYEAETSQRPRNGHSDPVISQMLFLDTRDTLDTRPNVPPAN